LEIKVLNQPGISHAHNADRKGCFERFSKGDS